MKNSFYKKSSASLLGKMSLMVMLLFVTEVLFSQNSPVTGDYRTTAATTFSSAANWQVYNGSAWVAALNAPYTTAFSSTTSATSASTFTNVAAITLASSNSNIVNNQLVLGNSIAAGTYVSGISGTSLTLSQACSGTMAASSTLTFLSTVATSGTTSASTTLTLAAASNFIYPGMFIYGAGITMGTSVTAVSGTTLTLSQAATTSSGTLVAFSFQNIQSGASTASLGSFTVTVPNSIGLAVGQLVIGTGIASNTTIQAIASLNSASSTTITLSTVTTAAVNTNLTFYAASVSANQVSGGAGSNVITLGGQNVNVAPGQYANGTGIPFGATVLSVNSASAPTTTTTAAVSSSTSISVASTVGLYPGQSVTGTGVSANTYISTITSTTAITVNQSQTSISSGTTLTFGSSYTVTISQRTSGNRVTNMNFGYFNIPNIYINHNVTVDNNVSSTIGNIWINNTSNSGAGAYPGGTSGITISSNPTLSIGLTASATAVSFTCGTINVSTGASCVQSTNSSTATNNMFLNGGNGGSVIVNNGTFNMITGSSVTNVSFCTANASQNASTAVTGSNTCAFNNITMSMGNTAGNTVDFQSVFTMATATTAHTLSFSYGTMKISSASTITPFGSVAGTIASTSVAAVSSLTATAASSNTLTFASTAGLSVGMYITSAPNTTISNAGYYISSLTSTVVTLTSNISSATLVTGSYNFGTGPGAGLTLNNSSLIVNGVTSTSTSTAPILIAIGFNLTINSGTLNWGGTNTPVLLNPLQSGGGGQVNLTGGTFNIYGGYNMTANGSQTAISGGVMNLLNAPLNVTSNTYAINSNNPSVFGLAFNNTFFMSGGTVNIGNHNSGNNNNGDFYWGSTNGIVNITGGTLNFTDVPTITYSILLTTSPKVPWNYIVSKGTGSGTTLTPAQYAYTSASTFLVANSLTVGPSCTLDLGLNVLSVPANSILSTSNSFINNSGSSVTVGGTGTISTQSTSATPFSGYAGTFPGAVNFNGAQQTIPVAGTYTDLSVTGSKSTSTTISGATTILNSLKYVNIGSSSVTGILPGMVVTGSAGITAGTTVVYAAAAPSTFTSSNISWSNTTNNTRLGFASGVTPPTGLAVGMVITQSGGTGFPTGTIYITAINPSFITISSAFTASQATGTSITLTFQGVVAMSANASTGPTATNLTFTAPTITLGSGTINVNGALNVNYTTNSAVTYTTTSNTLNVLASSPISSVTSVIASPFTTNILNVGSASVSAPTLSVASTLTNGSTTTVYGTLKDSTNGSISNAVVYSGAGSTLSLNQLPASTSYAVAASDKFWPSTGGPSNVTALQALNFNSQSRTVSGNFIAGAAVTSAGSLKATGTIQMNAGGSLDAIPAATSSYALIYNSAGSINTSTEWNTSGYVTNLTINTGSTVSAQSDLSMSGSWSRVGTFTPNSTSVTFTGSSPATISGATSFYNLTTGNSGGITLNNNVTVTNTLNLNGGIVTTGSNALSVTRAASGAVAPGTAYSSTNFINGSLSRTLPTSDAGQTYTFPIGSGTSYYPLALTSPTTSAGAIATAQVTLNGSGGGIDASLSGISGTEYWTLSASSGSITGGYLSLTRGIGVGTYTLVGSSSSLTGTYSSIGSSSTYSGNTISYASTDISSISSGTIGYFAYGYYSNNPTLSGFTIGGSSTTSGYFGQTLTINGSSFVSGATVSFNGGTDLATSFVNATQLTVTIPLTATSGNIVVTSGGTATNAVSFNINGYISSGAGDWSSTTADAPWPSGFRPAAGSTVVINSAVTVNNSYATSTAVPGNITINSSTGSLTFGASGSLTASSSFVNNGSVIMTSGGTLKVNGTFSPGTFTAGAGTVDFIGTNTITQSGTTTFNNITISNTLTAPSSTINVAGNWVNNGTFNANSGTVAFTGTSTISGSSTTSFNNINISGTLTAPSSTLNVAGSWVKTGTFNANGGTVVLNGNSQTISGSNTFFNLTKSVSSAATLTFTAGTTQTVSGTLTLNGATSNLLTVTSSTTSAATINPVIASVSYCNIAYISTSTPTSFTATNSVNGGNNINITTNISWVGSTVGNWSLASNWGTGTIPTTTDNVVFDNSLVGNTSPTVTLTGAVTVPSITFTSSNVTFAGAFAITTTSMTLSSCHITTVNALTINSSLTFLGTGSYIYNNAASNGLTITLGNGGAFTLTGCSASNYLDGNGNAYYTFNTNNTNTSSVSNPMTVYFNPTTTPTFGSINITAGAVVVGNNVSTLRVGLSSINATYLPILILGVNTVFTINGNGSSNIVTTANAGSIDASATGSKVSLVTIHPTILSASGNLFKAGTTINSLEMALTNYVFNLPQAITVKNLYLTGGTINNAAKSLTIASGGTIYYYGGILTAPPIFAGSTNVVVGNNVQAWAQSTPYSYGNIVSNAGNLFFCVAAGTSSSTTGPVTLSSNNGGFSDGTGTLKWNWLSSTSTTAGNELQYTGAGSLGSLTVSTGQTYTLNASSLAFSSTQGFGYASTSLPTVTVGTAWASGQNYSLNQWITYLGNVYIVTTAGLSTSTPPISTNSTPTSGTGAVFTYVTTVSTSVPVTSGGSGMTGLLNVSFTPVGSGYFTTAPAITIGAPATPTWSSSSAYILNNVVINGANVYYCSTAGTGNAVTGPTGTSTSATTADAAGYRWTYIGLASNIATATVTATLPASNAITTSSLTINGTGTVSFPNQTSALTLSTGTVTVASTATLKSATGTSVTHKLNIAGDFLQSGTFTSTNIDVTFNSSTASQTVSGVSTFNGLTINNTYSGGTITPSSSLTLNGKLTMTAGKLILNTNSITATGIAGGSNSSYAVITTGTLAASAPASTATLFPIGSSTTSYTPLTITPAAATTLTVGVKSITLPTDFISPVIDASKVVNLQWSVLGTVPTTASIKYQFNSANGASGYVAAADNQFGVYSGAGSYNFQNVSPTGTPYTFTVSGLSVNTSSNYYVLGRAGSVESSGTSWTGLYSTDWSDFNNWDNGVPSSLIDATIVSTARQPVISVSTTATVRDLIMNSGTTVVNSNILNIGRALTYNGTNATISGTGTTKLTGATGVLQNITGAGVVSNLTINNSLGATIGASSNLGVTGVLTLQTGTLTTNNKLTLKSTSIANTGTLAPYQASGNTGTLTGNVTVERYIPHGFRAYRDISPAVYGAGTIFKNWQLNGASTPGYGIFITGPTAYSSSSNAGTTDASGFDRSGTSTYNTQDYTFVNGSWTALANTNATNLDPFTGYRLLVRGDRTSNIYTSPVTNTEAGLTMYNSTTLSATGQLVTGTVTYSGTGVANTATGGSSAGLNTVLNGFSLVANPYAAPVQWGTGTGSNSSTTTVYGASDAASSGGINGSYWYLDPTSNATGKYIAFNALTGSAVGGYTSTSTVTSTGYIQQGQAVFVQSLTATPKVVFLETTKAVSSAKASVFGAASLSKIYVSLMKQGTTGYSNVDGAAVAFRPDFGNKAYGPQDAIKFSGANDNLAISDKGKNLSIDGRLPATASDAISLKITSPTATAYQLNIDASNYISNGFEPILYDAFKNTTKALGTGTTTINFSVDANNAASFSNRFTILFTPSALPVNSIVASASLNNKVATIFWKTAGEKNVVRYEVEKSADAKLFSTIGQSTAKNTATASYTTTDNSVTATTYYRIKAVSTTGAVSYSNVAKLSTDNRLPSYSLYPNPLKGGNIVTVGLGNVVAGKYTISIYNALGQRVSEQTISHTGGSATHAISINNALAAGAYSVTISEAGSKQLVHQNSLVIEN